MCCAWWTFRIFFNFFLLGEGEGGSPRRQEGIGFLLKIPGGGGCFRGGGEGPGGCARRIVESFWGGGLNIFFRGRNVHQVWCWPLICIARFSCDSDTDSTRAMPTANET